MDPLSMTGSIVSVATAAIQSVQFLSRTIDNIKDAPSIVRSVSADLQALQSVLLHLDKASQAGNSQIMRSAHIKRAIENCNKACNVFQAQLEHWMERSKDDNMFWLDRWKVGLFGLERVKSFRAQLSDCKGTLSVALNTSAILTTSRQEYIMKEMKDMMLQQNEVVVQQQIVQVDTGSAEVQRAVQHLMNDDQSGTPPQNKEELLQELKRQQETNKTFKDMCEEALFTTTHERTGQKIRGLKATNNSSALAGFINTSGDKWKINQDISDLHADNWSTALAGVIENVDFRNLNTGCANGSGRNDVRM